MTYNSCESDQLGQKSKNSLTCYPTFKTTISVDWSPASFVVRVLWRSCGQTITFRNVFLTLVLVVVQVYVQNFPDRLDNGYWEKTSYVSIGMALSAIKRQVCITAFTPEFVLSKLNQKPRIICDTGCEILMGRGGEMTEFRFPLNWTQHSPQLYYFVGNNKKTQTINRR